MKTIVVIPTYDEKDNVGPMSEAVLAQSPDIELLYVDDNSPDGTGDVIERLIAREPRIHCLHRTKKEGLGRAYVAGFQRALELGADKIVQMDCDFSHDPKDLPRLIAAMDEPLEIKQSNNQTIKQSPGLVIGSRYVPGGSTPGWPFKRRLISRAGGIFIRTVTGMPLRDPTGGLKCWKRETLEKIDFATVESAGYSFQLEMNHRTWKAGFLIKEIPIVFTDRVAGYSKITSGIAVESIKIALRLRFLSLLALAAFCGCASKDFVLVENAQPACELVLTGNARVDADLAFFTNAVDRISGVRLPLVAARTEGRNAIRFEVSETDLFHEDAYTAAFADARTLTVRGTKHSCRWALNRLLEERFGVVFCFPGEHGTHWPKAHRLALERMPFAGDASLKIERNLYREDSAWERCVGGKEQKVDQFYNHNLCNIFPRQKYAEDPWREKLMPLRNGKRVRPLSDEGWQPCLSAPEAVTEAVKNIRAYLAAHPDEQVFSLTMNDNGGYCDCDACKAMNGGTFDEPRKFGPPNTTSRSQTYFRWANAVAKEMAKTHPNVVFGLLAYGATIDPPPFRLEHNLLPFLCASVYQNHNEEIWQKRVGLMKAWGEKCDAFGLWDYAYGMQSYAAPRVYNDVVDRYFNLKNTECPSFNAYFGEGSSLPGEGPKRWFYYKKIFDTTLTAEKALPVWYRACCGAEAAPFLQAYYELWEGFWTGEAIRSTSWYKSIDRGYCDFNSFAYLNALDDATIARSTELLEQAVAAAQTSGTADQRIRARWIEECHRYYLARITLKRSYLAEAPYNGSSEPTETPAETAKLVAKLPAYSRALEDVKIYAQRVLDSRGLDSWRWGVNLRRFLALSFLDASLEANLIAMAKHASTPDVKQALAAVLADPRTTPRFQALAKGLLEGPHGPDRLRALVKTEDEDFAAWTLMNSGVTTEKAAPTDGGTRLKVVGTGGWSAIGRTVRRGIPTGKFMSFAGRIENRSQHEIKVRIHYEAWGTRGTSRIVPVKPGETKVAAVPLESRSNTPKFYFIFNGLEKGDELYVDSISLRDLE